MNTLSILECIVIKKGPVLIAIVKVVILSIIPQQKTQEFVSFLFHRLSDTQNRLLLNSKTDLRVSLLRTSSRQKGFASREVHIWNAISNERN